MPWAPKRPCNHAGCGALSEGRFCAAHARAVRRADDQRRGSAAARGYGARWRRERAAFLAAHPLCAECAKSNVVTAASVVDHIIPHRGDDALMWDRSNWQPLCKRHHDEKTAREDGAFGRAPLHKV